MAFFSDKHPTGYRTLLVCGWFTYRVDQNCIAKVYQKYITSCSYFNTNFKVITILEFIAQDIYSST